MAQPQGPALPQSDFAAIANDMTELGQDISNRVTSIGQQSALCGNIAAVAGADATAASLAAINTNLGRLDARMGGLETRMTNLETRVGGLEASIQTERANTAARLWNRFTGMNDILQPLRSPITHQIIPNFPRTKRDMRTLGVLRVVELLNQLDQPIQGTPDDKLRHLHIMCGLTRM
ncbi:hypothetical protein F4680DRAFT_244280 [Xylaria scruposa]|nr:hypothetical protein F4680DRAFT_244280 [Xylaria scruposa]